MLTVVLILSINENDDGRTLTTLTVKHSPPFEDRTTHFVAIQLDDEEPDDQEPQNRTSARFENPFELYELLAQAVQTRRPDGVTLN